MSTTSLIEPPYRVVQTDEHYQSRVHKEAIEFFQTNDGKDEKKKDALRPPERKMVNKTFSSLRDWSLFMWGDFFVLACKKKHDPPL